MFGLYLVIIVLILSISFKNDKFFNGLSPFNFSKFRAYNFILIGDTFFFSKIFIMLSLNSVSNSDIYII